MNQGQHRPLRVGLTYDLASEHLSQGASEEDVAEFDADETIVALCTALQQMGHQPERIGGIRSLTEQLAAGRRWDLVFNIAEGKHGAARESQVPALLDAFEIPYTFSDPLVLGVALHKGHAKAVVRSRGVPTADYHLVRSPSDIAKCSLTYPIFAKPVAEGTSKGITADSIITEPDRLGPTCLRMLERYAQPVLLETYLPGREFTVGILGTGQAARTLGTLEVHLVGDADVGVYSYRNKKQFVGKVEYRLLRPEADPVVREVEAVALRAWDVLECRDAGRVDIRLDASDKPCFIEVNPLAGLNPEISDLAILVRQSGQGYQSLIEGIMESAIQRLERSP
jgi:D-alanine-D-alanine ligase